MVPSGLRGEGEPAILLCGFEYAYIQHTPMTGRASSSNSRRVTVMAYHMLTRLARKE